MNLPECAIFPTDKLRVKIEYLMWGLKQLGIACIQVKYKEPLPGNHMGPYIYPIIFKYKGGIEREVFFDIYPYPSKVFKYLNSDNLYYKVHVLKSDLKKHDNMRIMPNSIGNMLYIHTYEVLRCCSISLDVFSIFNNDDHGLRLKTSEKLFYLEKYKKYIRVDDNRTGKTDVIPLAIRGEFIEYLDYITLQSTAKISIALPGGRGAGGPGWWTFRHSEAMGLGRLIFTISPRPEIKILDNSEGCWVEFKEDLSDLEAILDYYLSHDKELKEKSENGMRFFDNFLTPMAHAKHMLSCFD